MSYLPRHIEETLVCLLLLRNGCATLSDHTQVMLLRDRLVRSDYYVVSLELGWGHRSTFPVVDAVTECTRLDMVFNLFFPVRHDGERHNYIDS